MPWTQEIVKPEHQLQRQPELHLETHTRLQKKKKCGKEGKFAQNKAPKNITTQSLSSLEQTAFAKGQTQQGVKLLTLLAQEF